jgi:Coenzyme PQQ synthesis protein D (PqqD)
MIGTQSLIAASKDQVSKELEGEVIILDLARGAYYGLDGVAARVWDLIQEPKTAQQVLQILVAEYDVEPARCETDLRSLLEDLAAHQLIEVTTGSSA